MLITLTRTPNMQKILEHLKDHEGFYSFEQLQTWVILLSTFPTGAMFFTESDNMGCIVYIMNKSLAGKMIGKIEK